ALLRVMNAIEAQEEFLDDDEATGFRMLVRALDAPTRQIAENSGVDAGVVVDRMRHGAGNMGFNAATGTYVDLMETGIIDPTKVTRIALENAVSVASTLLLTEATLTEERERKTEKIPVPEFAE
ncbi:MAG TPA: TCP-1/cpn60 chaperonin family protein, partial [Nitrospira sp.]|nr:TCP-1/cpn60 chaperonin family protein [Nitrospira sp.]